MSNVATLAGAVPLLSVRNQPALDIRLGRATHTG